MSGDTMDEGPPPDAVVIAFPGGRDTFSLREALADNPIEVDPFREMVTCAHNRIALNPEIRVVTCRDCKKPLDPIDVLMGWHKLYVSIQQARYQLRAERAERDRVRALDAERKKTPRRRKP